MRDHDDLPTPDDLVPGFTTTAERLAFAAAKGLGRGHDISRGEPGSDGRCKQHRIRGCRWCEENKSHG